MKKLYIVIIIVVIIGFAFFGWWYFSAPPAPQTTQKLAEEKVVPLQTFLLTVLDNNVSVKPAPNEPFTEVLGTTVNVNEGSNVKTSLTGRATIESLGQSTVVVDKNSEFTVAESTQHKTTISLLAGNLWAKVQKLFGQGEYFKVQTPNAVVTVRGTSFGVLYANDVTTVMVAESRVSLLSIDPKTLQPIGEEVMI
ncbi:MAG: FecR domain-containing protein, partial [Candidatus Paceibacterales bacterium]